MNHSFLYSSPIKRSIEEMFLWRQWLHYGLFSIHRDVIFLNWNFIWITLQSLVVWEIATEAVLERESLMTKIEDFERTASDPNRFFVKGNFEFSFPFLFNSF